MSGVSVAMETGRAGDRLSAESGSCAFGGATWTPASRQARVRSPSESTRLSSVACSEASHYGFGGRARRAGPTALRPLPEPPLLRLRPTSLRTQDISHLLTGLFRSLYTNEVIGEDLSANLIKARGSQDARHEEFVDELRRVRRPGAPRAPCRCSPGTGRGTVRGTQGATPERRVPTGLNRWTNAGTCRGRGPGDAAGKAQSPCVGAFDSVVEGHAFRAFT